MDNSFEKKTQAKFLQYIKTENLCQAQSPLLLAVSGGVDSVVMVDLLHQVGFCIAGIAHANFQLRGEDSEQDMEFVANLAQHLQVPFFCQRFDTDKERKIAGESVQMAARRLRYDWLRTLAQELNALIVTAHHFDDNLETVLLNLVRGTGWAGLHGILPKYDNIIRPLLTFTKKEVMNYAHKRQLLWREDYTNAQTKYKRNFLRHEVIPLLRQLNPDLENTFQQTLKKIMGVEKVFVHSNQQLQAKFFQQQGKDAVIPLSILEELASPAEQMYAFLQAYHFSYPQIEDLVASATGDSGKLFFSATHQIVKDRNSWIISPLEPSEDMGWLRKEENYWENTLFSLKWAIFERTETFNISTEKNMAYLDADKLAFPLLIRLWENGDFFYPLGLGGKKKVSDLLIDLKVPLPIKQRTFVLLSDNEIVWVIGQRISQHYCVSNQTTTILHITQEIL